MSDSDGLSEYGSIGLGLEEMVRQRVTSNLYKQLKEKFKNKLYINQLDQCEQVVRTIYNIDPLAAIWAALQIYQIPLQCHMTLVDLAEVMKHVGFEVKEARHVDMWINNDRAVFPLKEHPGARTKTNVFFCDAYKDARKYYAVEVKFFLLYAGHLEGMANDTATGWLMWFCLTYRRCPLLAAWCLSNCHEQVRLKELSLLIKTVGIAQDKVLACFVELDVLIGRAANPLDREEDIRTRVDYASFVEEKWCGLDGAALEYAVDEIMNEELPVQPVWPDVDEFWSKRWVWAKAGAHSNAIDKLMFGHNIVAPQSTRREFLEAVDENLIAAGEAVSLCGQSEKLEHGKGRGLYSKDTRSYVTMHYLLDPVERNWQNKKIWLNVNPSGFTSATYAKLAGSLQRYKLMLDYADFNSQHSLSALNIVLRRACRGAPQHVVEWACAANLNSWIAGGDSKERRLMVGTLATGDRATSFYNSVLNRAYLLAIARDEVWQMTFVHVGDDVFGTCSDASVVDRLLFKIGKSKIRIKRAKQGIGTLSAEFLRVSFDERGGVGYLARSIATTVSGNWTTDAQLDEVNYVSQYPQMAWAMVNRSNNAYAGLLLETTLIRRVPALLHEAHDILRGVCSINGGPIRSDGAGYVAELNTVYDKTAKEEREGAKPSFATDAYLTKHVDMSVLKQLKLNGGLLKGPMLEASYPRPIGARHVKSVTKSVIDVATFIHTDFASNVPPKVEGALTKILSLVMIKNLLTRSLLGEALNALGLPGANDPVHAAWGQMAQTVCTLQLAPYADMMALATHLTRSCSIYVTYVVAL